MYFKRVRKYKIKSPIESLSPKISTQLRGGNPYWKTNKQKTPNFSIGDSHSTKRTVEWEWRAPDSLANKERTLLKGQDNGRYWVLLYY